MKNLHYYTHAAIQNVELTLLKVQLEQTFLKHAQQLREIEDAFVYITQSKPDKVALSFFFHNWNLTNNNSISLLNYCHHLVNLLEKQAPVGPSQAYLDVLSRLQPLSDTKTEFNGKVFNLANKICGHKDWLAKRYLLQEGIYFKKWINKTMLRNKDLYMGLLICLIHAIYLQTECQYAFPLFKKWLTESMNHLDESEQQDCLVWLEQNSLDKHKHLYYERLQIINELNKAMGSHIKYYNLQTIFGSYITNKAKVMTALVKELKQHNSASHMSQFA